MSPIAKRALLLVGPFIVLVACTSLFFVSFNGAAARGIAVGAALGIVNIVVSLLIAQRSLRKGMQSIMTTIVGGFGIRLVMLVGLFLAFKQSSVIDAPAFALTFVVFFFVYAAAEILMVERVRAPRHA